MWDRFYNHCVQEARPQKSASVKEWPIIQVFVSISCSITRVGFLKLCLRLLHAIEVVVARGTQPVRHDLLHRLRGSGVNSGTRMVWGFGGSTCLGGGPRSASSGAGRAGACPGTGGSDASLLANTAAVNGGDGANGIVIVWEYLK